MKFLKITEEFAISNRGVRIGVNVFNSAITTYGQHVCSPNALLTHSTLFKDHNFIEIDVLPGDVIWTNTAKLTLENKLITKKPVYNLASVMTSVEYFNKTTLVKKEIIKYSRNSNNKVVKSIIPEYFNNYYEDEFGILIQSLEDRPTGQLPEQEVKVFTVIDWGNFKRSLASNILIALVDSVPAMRTTVDQLLIRYKLEFDAFKDNVDFHMIEAFNNESEEPFKSLLAAKPYESATGHPFQNATIKDLVLARFVAFKSFLDGLVYVAPTED